MGDSGCRMGRGGSCGDFWVICFLRSTGERKERRSQNISRRVGGPFTSKQNGSGHTARQKSQRLHETGVRRELTSLLRADVFGLAACGSTLWKRGSRNCVLREAHRSSQRCSSTPDHQTTLRPNPISTP